MSQPCSKEIHCPECYRAVPDEAEFCPYCGRAARVSSKREEARRRAETTLVDVVPPVDEFVKEQRVAAAVLAGFMVASGLLVWLAFAGPSDGGDGATETRRASAAGAEGVSEALEKARESAEATDPSIDAFSYRVGTDERTDHQMAVVGHDGEHVLRLYTPRESEYETLEARIRSVMLQIERGARRHLRAAPTAKSPQVLAQAENEKWTVVWTDGERTQGLVNVSSEDVRHWNQRPDTDVTQRELAERMAADLDALFEDLARANSGV